MEHSHQPEPWKLTFDDGGPENPALRDREGVIIADVYGNANGRRIVACVNACEGISDEALDNWMNPPDGGFGHPHGPWPAHIISLQRAAESVTLQRNKLLVALKECLATYGATAGRIPPTTQEAERILDRIRAANEQARTVIAKIEASE